MTRTHLGMVALALGLVAAPALQAQKAQPTEGVSFGLGAGLILPTGNYGTADKAGWHVMGLIQLPIAQSPIHLRFDGMYGMTSNKAGGGSIKLAGGTADLLYHLGDRAASVRPYVLGGLGFYNVNFGAGTSESKFAFGLGGGVLFGVGTMHAFVEGRYMSIQTSGSSLTFLPITVGLMLR
jgi:hypothetical protein